MREVRYGLLKTGFIELMFPIITLPSGAAPFEAIAALRRISY